MSHTGCPYDHAVAEAAFKSIKTEFVKDEVFGSLAELEMKFDCYVKGFNSKHLHSTLGYYNRHRYYSRAGRYITQDPIGLMGGFNGYNYPLNPAQKIDPLGLQVCYVAFPNMPIQTDIDWIGETTWVGGHAGVLVYHNKGITRYYEYGRYNRNVAGLIGHIGDDVGIPNLVMDEKW